MSHSSPSIYSAFCLCDTNVIISLDTQVRFIFKFLKNVVQYNFFLIAWYFALGASL